MTKFCPFCHKQIFALFYRAHIAAHARRLPDGQQKDHYTVEPGKRFEGSLENVPQIYYHAKCGARTQMPEEVVRSYLADPFLYNGTTFCCGCHTYVSMRELVWVETGELLSNYMKQLQREHIASTQGEQTQS